jgi:hypothetical protein
MKHCPLKKQKIKMTIKLSFRRHSEAKPKNPEAKLITLRDSSLRSE